MQGLDSLFAILLLIAVVIMWLFARKDLNARAAERHAPTVAELEKVRATVEDLINVLEERAILIERRLTALIEEAREVSAAAQVERRSVRSARGAQGQAYEQASSAGSHLVAKRPGAASEPAGRKGAGASGAGKDVARVLTETTAAESGAPDEPDLYREVYRLADQGVGDPVEIARQTGLGKAEVELVLSLRTHVG